MADMLHVNPDLMGSSGLQAQLTKEQSVSRL